MPAPYANEDALNKILLGTVPSPGTVKLDRLEDPANWNIKEANGWTGASMTLRGQNPREFDATFYLVTDQDFDDWDVFQKVIDTMTAVAKPFALPVYHPDLARLRYTEVTKKSVGGLVYDGKGGASVKVTFIEYKPPKKKKGTSPTAKPAAGNTTPDPNAAAKAELAALLAQARGP